MKSENHTNEIRGLLRYMSESKLELMRNLSFAASGTLVANILLLTQIGTADLALKVSLFASALALPIWISQASIYETYIFRGPRSYSHIRSDFTLRLISTLNLIGGLGLYTAVCAVVWHLDAYAAIGLVFSSFLALVIAGVHNDHLKNALSKSTDVDA